MVARLGAMVNSADIILRSGALLKKYVSTRPRVDAAREDPHAADAAFSAPLAPALIRAFPLDATRADPLDAPANPSILPRPLVVATAHLPIPLLRLVSSGTSTTFPTWRWPPCETPRGAKPTPSPKCMPP